MDPTETERLRRWVEQWRVAGQRMEELRREELRRVDTQQAMMQLDDAFESAIFLNPPAPTSGLVEQQAWFRKLRS